MDDVKYVFLTAIAATLLSATLYIALVFAKLVLTYWFILTAI